ncbi:MAG: serine/threonine-protein kinase [Acidobacteriota bacterium]
MAPDRIGRYRLTQRLGEGGTGTVYRAEPVAGGDPVAIKILRHGPWSPQAGRRFAAERHMLARLDHPFVARLLDGGTTPNGSPYLVMELVDGEPIDVYCARHQLTIEQRIRLFMPVCAAVHEAHRNLIVHRDLKPSNILVTHGGVPKLLDFGIAKLLEPGAESMTGSQIPMTPRYASPEQLAGGPVTTVSDVYSLGLLLHELLTGRRLFEEADTPAAVLEHRVREVRPDRPSLVAPPELQRRLRGDLDRIVGMALAEEPERRYASAAQLAEDLERHLERRPVRAQPDTLLYRLSRFVRRHQLAVFLVAVIVVAWAFAGWQARRASAQRAEVSQLLGTMT